MKTIQVYQKFMTPMNLQEHMLRVASLAKIISGNWKSKNLDEASIIKACLIHDIAKPITFDPDKQVLFDMSPEQVDDLKKLKLMIANNYGTDEHPAAVKIASELGLNTVGIRIMENLEWDSIVKVLQEKDPETSIALYSDMRVAPSGILKMEERLADLKKREPAKKHEEYARNGKLLEQFIAKMVNINLNSINDSQTNSIIEELRNLEF